jgi:hypothetical protein
MLTARLVAVLLFGYLGFREARSFERAHGRPPFGIPAWAWAPITGFSLLIGAVLLAVARRRAKKHPPQPPVPATWGDAPVTSTAPSAFQWAGPERADVWAAPVSAPAAAPTATAPTATPAGVPAAAVPGQPSVTASRDILPGR